MRTDHVDSHSLPKRDEGERLEQLQQGYTKLKAEIHKAVVGQEEVVDAVLCAILAGGHCMVQGVPGLAKTLLVHSISEAMNLSFNRIQFTPDLMPSDITGTDIIQENKQTGHREYQFLRGPIFANIILADEINRTPPKTQAALLQAMQEHEVTAGGTTFRLEEPFFVLATQNPIEQEGTYPLPEAQLDRFIFNLWIDYPSEVEERQIVRSTTGIQDVEVTPALNAAQIVDLQKLIRKVPVADHVINYAVGLVRKTRPGNADVPSYISEMVSWGAGPRASQYLILGAKARAVLEGRYAASIDDVQSVAVPVLRHRIVTNFNAEAEGVTAVDLVGRLIEEARA